MKCPCCGNNMERGRLKSRGGVYFLPDGESEPKLYSEKEMERHRAIPFPPRLLQTKPEYPAAFVCRACGRMIVDFPGV